MAILLIAMLWACGRSYPFDERITNEPSRGPDAVVPDAAPRVHRGRSADGALSTEVDARVVDYLHSSGLPGAAVAIVRHGEIVHTAGYGWADTDADQALTADTPMLLASLSKTFLGVATMQRVERGELALDTQVTELVDFQVDNPHRPGDSPTLRHVMNHTAALYDSTMYYGQFVDGEATRSLEDYTANFVDATGDVYSEENFLDSAPGEDGVYSNMSAGLGATALAAHAGQPFDTLIRQEILEPLGMTHSAFKVSALPVASATGYSSEGDHLVTWMPFSHPNYADGMMRSSANDMAAYMAAVQSDALLAAASRDTMWTVGLGFHTPQDDGQAIMWARRLLDGRDLRGHSGYHYGTTTEMWFDPESGTGVLLLLNANPDLTNGGKRIVLQRRLLDLGDRF